MLPHSLGRYSGPPGRASLPILAILFFVFLCISSFASAQLVNGQFFTNGMAISDSPAPRSQTNAGGNLNIAIDLSGDGKLSQDAFLPTSNLPSAYQSLNIYLISGETNLNLSVSEGPQLLEQEPGSTVKHLNWPIPACVLSGNYNVTLYELSRFNQVSYYSITPIPIIIKSQSTSSCSGAATPDPQPQASSPPPQQPWLTPGSSLTTPLTPSSTPNSNPSQSSGAVPVTSYPSNNSGTVTITLSPSPTTVTFVSTMTVPTTVSGIATVFTTATTIASVSTVLPSSGGTFLPVNSAVGSLHCVHWLSIAIIWAVVVAIC